ncbi:hypothetical protein A33O_19389 [Nitratireductor aquibiodomus RA22]|uniref:Uncharacterized protein n=1 Tax=Nitratireductor aquibiodomus RA22 TaxID=1189611 RepID=I5BSE5_9HYPH|nr:hypothetical protein A33O_19389 [Nitratireductor aquibiodomus RA22]
MRGSSAIFRLLIILDTLFDGAEDGMAPTVFHLDTHRIAEAQERRLWFTVCYRLDHADFSDTGVTDPALVNRLSGSAVQLVGYRTRADDRAGAERTRFGSMGNQRREIECHIDAGVGPTERLTVKINT